MLRTPSTDQYRSEIEAALSCGRWHEARAGLEALWREHTNSATASYVVSRFQDLRQHLPFRRCRVAILRSFTVEPALPFLRAGALLGGIDLQVRVSDHNTYAQEILNRTGPLYRDEMDAVIVAVQLRDIAPALWYDYTRLSPAQRDEAVAEVLGRYREWIEVFRATSDAALIVHLFEQPANTSEGILDAQQRDAQRDVIHGANLRLRELARTCAGVYVLDYDALVSRHGRAAWHDEQKWLTVKLPLAAGSVAALANEWLRFLHPISGRIGKVLVTDLDNTLWGGVVGEDGVNGIQVDREYPGAAYQALQRVMLDLTRRGILLAIASKNNEPDVLQVFGQHPGMLLRAEHFAAMRINWRDKAGNVREIAAELNIGLDSVVFLDDNPAERAQMRRELPEVTVVELPADPMRFAGILQSVPMFERLTLAEEDARRQQYYAQQRLRAELQHAAPSVEDFYRSLAQVVEIGPLMPRDVARAAQLTQKTNQFNLTTRRYGEVELARLADSPHADVYTVRVADRFGDNGLVGLCIALRSDGQCEIDTLLLSCRVIGRTVESAVLHHLAEESRAKGARFLVGRYLATPKNAPAATFYAEHGFTQIGADERGEHWRLDLSATRPACPAWIDLRARNGLEAVHA